ncbi:MAG: aspartyl/asparaginyl beta-hydroxylase domain-containing protein [Verrucomicrobia bacterium]|nr:aspartyl/asparaginyl beta-hydroxylase domain-containing protein [Verrucomicrobiota bacterium]
MHPPANPSSTAVPDGQFIPPPPPATFFARAVVRFIDWVERGIARHAVFGNPPVYDPARFPWIAEIERDWRLIRAELDAVLTRHDELPNFQDISVDVKTIQRDNQWKTFFFLGYGRRIEENLRRCPETARLLKKIPRIKTAFFSILSPHKHIPAHRGPYNGVLRYHLGLLVPEPRERCRIRVADQYLVWEEGRTLVFDDSFNHEVWNDTDGRRAVLFVDFERPVRFPFNLLNKLVLSLAVFTPYIREAEQNQKAWERKFYARR